MGHEVNCKWLNNMAFETDILGHTLTMDASPKVGGENRGPLPKPLTLASLAGCTGMDVVSILNKMRVELEGFDIKVHGELTEEHPKYYHKIHLTYTFQGKNLPLEKLERAVQLSQEKYCGVSALLSKGAEVTYEIKSEA
ncbi:OsmC family protein [Clostridiaceae bacterium 35-E11]